jgi:hypothetical protein
MVDYICWGEDGEDLGDKVREEITRAQKRGDWNFGMDDEERPLIEIVVWCSKGHRNILEI